MPPPTCRQSGQQEGWWNRSHQGLKFLWRRFPAKYGPCCCSSLKLRATASHGRNDCCPSPPSPPKKGKKGKDKTERVPLYLPRGQPGRPRGGDLLARGKVTCCSSSCFRGGLNWSPTQPLAGKAQSWEPRLAPRGDQRCVLTWS